MKCKISRKDLKSALNSIEALQNMGVDSSNDNLKCVFSLEKDTLYIEGAHMGAYVKKTIRATPLREGKFGAGLKELSKCKFSGDVTLDYNQEASKLRATAKRSRFDIPGEQGAIEATEDSRPTERGDIHAIVPAQLMVDAVSAVTFKPGLKQEDLRMQFSITKTDQGGQVEVVGLDHFSYARFVRASKDVQVKTDLKFVLQSKSPGVVLKEITADKLAIGMVASSEGADPTMVRFKSDDADIYYPILNTPYLEAGEVANDAREGEFNGGFVAYRKQLREAVNTVRVVGDNATSLILYVKLEGTDARIAAESGGSVAEANIATDNVRLGDQPQFIMQISEKYFSDFLAIAPDVVPLRIESWNRKHAILRALKLENGLIEYFMAQVNMG